MKKTITSWQMTGFIFTSIAGTLLHFLFDWTGQHVAAALFSAVNESIWEHMKLIYYPMLIFALIEYRAWGRGMAHFWCVKLRGILLALVLIPAIYYMYTGMLGRSADWFNIAIFFIVAGVAYRQETVRFRKEKACLLPGWAAFGLICLIGVIFILLTFVPPHIPLFRDPVTGGFGFRGDAAP